MTYQPDYRVKIRFAYYIRYAAYMLGLLSFEDEIRSIKEADHQDYKFTIELPEGG